MDHLILFTRAAERGKVKTRLAAEIGSAAALKVHRLLLARLWTLCQDHCTHPMRRGRVCWSLSYTPAGSRASLPTLPPGVDANPQQGDDLGQRMALAFHQGFRSCPRSYPTPARVLLFGSDLPLLSSALFERAFLRLRRFDVVLAPSLDGGYGLIGLRRSALQRSLDALLMPPAPPLSAAPLSAPSPKRETPLWGHESVLQQTLRAAQEAELTVHLLPPLSDLDRLEDLSALLQHPRHHAPAAQENLRALQSACYKRTRATP